MSIELDFKQATELLGLYGGEPAAYTLSVASGHVYAHLTEYPEEGFYDLGETENEAVPDDEWTVDLPDAQGLYWNWDGNEDHAPVALHVMYSGTDNSYFVTAGQMGMSRSKPCRDIGGHWFRVPEPSIPVKKCGV